MLVHVNRVPDEPILIATLNGRIVTGLVEEMYRLSTPLIDEIGGHVWRIIDARAVETSFSDAIFILLQVWAGQPGSTSDPRVSPIIIGSKEWLRVYRASQQARAASTIPMFADLPDALDFIWQQMDQINLRQAS